MCKKRCSRNPWRSASASTSRARPAAAVSHGVSWRNAGRISVPAPRALPRPVLQDPKELRGVTGQNCFFFWETMKKFQPTLSASLWPLVPVCVLRRRHSWRPMFSTFCLFFFRNHCCDDNLVHPTWIGWIIHPNPYSQSRPLPTLSSSASSGKVGELAGPALLLTACSCGGEEAPPRGGGAARLWRVTAGVAGVAVHSGRACRDLRK